jgi:hypothetical protein
MLILLLLSLGLVSFVAFRAQAVTRQRLAAEEMERIRQGEELIRLGPPGARGTAKRLPNAPKRMPRADDP